MCNFKTDKLVDNWSSVMNKSIIQTDNCRPNLMQMLIKLFCNIWNILFFIQGFKCQNSSGVAWQAFKGNFSMSVFAYISIMSSMNFLGCFPYGNFYYFSMKWLILVTIIQDKEGIEPSTSPLWPRCINKYTAALFLFESDWCEHRKVYA